MAIDTYATDDSHRFTDWRLRFNKLPSFLIPSHDTYRMYPYNQPSTRPVKVIKEECMNRSIDWLNDQVIVL